MYHIRQRLWRRWIKQCGKRSRLAIDYRNTLDVIVGHVEGTQGRVYGRSLCSQHLHLQVLFNEKMHFQQCFSPHVDHITPPITWNAKREVCKHHGFTLASQTDGQSAKSLGIWHTSPSPPSSTRCRGTQADLEKQLFYLRSVDPED